MLVTEQWGVRFEVSEEKMRHEGVLGELASVAARSLSGDLTRDMGEGVEVPAEAMLAEVVSTDDKRMTRTVEVIYHPDTRRGVIFEGGPHDGLERVIATGQRRAAEQLVVPAPGQRPVYVTDETVPPHPRPSNLTYLRVGIDAHSSRWVYRWDGR